MSTYNFDSELIDILLDFGEAMLGSGAEIARVEDSLSRMGNAYGAERTNAFVINSSIELTVRFSDGETVTRTRAAAVSCSVCLWKSLEPRSMKSATL